jgi:hypothetical protein
MLNELKWRTKMPYPDNMNFKAFDEAFGEDDFKTPDPQEVVKTISLIAKATAAISIDILTQKYGKDFVAHADLAITTDSIENALLDDFSGFIDECKHEREVEV